MTRRPTPTNPRRCSFSYTDPRISGRASGLMVVVTAWPNGRGERQRSSRLTDQFGAERDDSYNVVTRQSYAFVGIATTRCPTRPGYPLRPSSQSERKPAVSERYA